MLWGWGGCAQFLNNLPSTVPKHTTDKPAETQRNTESVVQACTRARVCVCVFQSTHCDRTLFENTVTGNTYQLAPPANSVACMHTHYKHLCSFIHSSSLTYTQQNPPHTDACTDSTHRLFLFSQLCSDIKQSPLRENKHADEERLAGHRGCQCTHKHTHRQTHTHINACTDSAPKLNDCQFYNKLQKATWLDLTAE